MSMWIPLGNHNALEITFDHLDVEVIQSGIKTVIIRLNLTLKI